MLLKRDTLKHCLYYNKIAAKTIIPYEVLDIVKPNKRRRPCRRIVAMVPWYLRQNTRFFLKSQTSELQCIYPLYRKESVILFSLKAICMVRFTYIYCITKPFLPIKRIQDLVTDGNIDN